jgi:hypothetical protein
MKYEAEINQQYMYTWSTFLNFEVDLLKTKDMYIISYLILQFCFAIFPDKCSNLKLSSTSGVIHVTNLAKDFPFFPSLVMYATYRPHTTYKSNTTHELESVSEVL